MIFSNIVYVASVSFETDFAILQVHFLSPEDLLELQARAMNVSIFATLWSGAGGSLNRQVLVEGAVLP